MKRYHWRCGCGATADGNQNAVMYLAAQHQIKGHTSCVWEHGRRPDTERTIKPLRSA